MTVVDSAIPRPKVLIVDDTPANLLAIRRLLARLDIEVIEAENGNAALSACLDHDFALILLDVNMPDMSGFEVAELLAEETRTRDTPVMFLTAAYSDDLSRLKGYSFGAVDYITKPINDTVLLSKVNVFLELYRSRAQLKAALEELSRRNMQLQMEIQVRRRAEEDARHQAMHDALTGLPNRVLFIDRLRHALERSRRRGTRCALLYIDIDGFKPVNDGHGHQVGDALLCEIACRLLLAVRKADTVARLGGDEFAVIMEDPPEVDDAVAGARRLGEILRQSYRLPSPKRQDEMLEISVDASVGLAVYPQDADSTDALIRVADAAMYRIKHSRQRDDGRSETAVA